MFQVSVRVHTCTCEVGVHSCVDVAAYDNGGGPRYTSDTALGDIDVGVRAPRRKNGNQPMTNLPCQ